VDLDDGRMRLVDRPVLGADTRRAQQVLGWAPATDLMASLRAALEDYRSRAAAASRAA